MTQGSPGICRTRFDLALCHPRNSWGPKVHDSKWCHPEATPSECPTGLILVWCCGSEGRCRVWQTLAELGSIKHAATRMRLLRGASTGVQEVGLRQWHRLPQGRGRRWGGQTACVLWGLTRTMAAVGRRGQDRMRILGYGSHLLLLPAMETRVCWAP
jgi:hypothetical protein